MSGTGIQLLVGIALFALGLGVIGFFLGAAESAERRLRELGRDAREPYNFDGADDRGQHPHHPIHLSGPTPTG